jgi:hypothetical protein
MNNLPSYISITFILTTLLAVWIFYKSTKNFWQSLIILLAWLTLQMVVSLTGFNTVTNNFPPRFILLPMPMMLFIIILFVTKMGRQFIDRLDIKTLTILHIIRIPVEVVLYWLFINKTIPQLMTFEGRNFDILSGITAPLVYYFGFIKPVIHRKIILLWNIFCLGLLINIVIIAIFSAPFTFQQLAYDQPNIAILYFPFTWLPCCVVPIVLFAHLAVIRGLTIKRDR